MNAQLITELHIKRYSAKKFTTEAISQENKEVILNSVNLAPTSYGIQPFKVLVIETQAIKDKISPIAFNQEPFKTAEFILVWCVEDNFEELLSKYSSRIVLSKRSDQEIADQFTSFIASQKEPTIARHGSLETWYAKQAYISLGFAMATCSVLQVDSCAMEGFIPSALDEVLGLNELGLKSQVMLAIGVADTSDNKTTPKVRKTLEEIFIKL